VASLEARNEQAVSENENLRDLLARLQNENMMLKGASPFTFSVPKNAASSAVEQSSSPASVYSSPLTIFDNNMSSDSSMTSSPPVPTATAQNTLFPDDSFDWNSLMSFDPAVLSLLDDNTQRTATDDGTIPVQYGFDDQPPWSPKMPFTTIASNPGFMSYADEFDASSSSIPVTGSNPFDFDSTTWPTPPPPSSETNDIFGVNGYGQQPSAFGASMTATPSPFVSPVIHATNPRMNTVPSSSASPAAMQDDPNHKCPNSKEEFQKLIVDSGPSPFAPAPTPSVRKASDEQAGVVIECQGAAMPKTEKNDQNVEVMKAWASIRADPKFKVRLCFVTFAAGYDLNNVVCRIRT